MKQATFAAAFDSQLKWCSKIRDEMERRGIICRIVVPNIRNALSPRQIADVGISHVEPVTWQEMISIALNSDIFISSLSGPTTKRISIELAHHAKESGARSPVLVAGWVGVIIEKLVAGYLDRIGCDLIAVNSKSDWDRFHNVANILDLPIDNLIMTGLPFTSNLVTPQRNGAIKSVLFADQPTVPAAPNERLYIYKRLIEYAKSHPDRSVILKPRHRPDEDTFHKMKHHPEELLSGIERPPNFKIDYTSITDVLPAIDLLLTMSSTAAIEGIAAGCRVGLILDLGVHEKYGNPVFLESGLLRTFEAIEADDIGSPCQKWISEFFPMLSEPPAKIIVNRAISLIDRDVRPSDLVRQTSYFKGASEFHFSAEKLKRELNKRKSTPFADRLRTYSPAKRMFVRFWERVLPDVVATPIYGFLRRKGYL
ncbi:DUF6716 putative glycosyltransferase [Sinorhizobium meliloti]|uniref:DUF6716 putative glycosyltransferase n=1 Tax=Rhizobium meliloti TaxID=382 RepID=UPI003D658DCA